MHLPYYFLEFFIATMALIGFIIGWFSRWRLWVIALWATFGVFAVIFVSGQATAYDPTRVLWSEIPLVFGYTILGIGLPVTVGSVIGCYLRKRRTS